MVPDMHSVSHYGDDVGMLQVEHEKQALEAQLSELKYELRQAKASAEANAGSLQAEVDRLTRENQALQAAAGMDTGSAVGSNGMTGTAAGAGAGSTGSTTGMWLTPPSAAPPGLFGNPAGAGITRSARTTADVQGGAVSVEAVAALRAELAAAQLEKVELEAKLEQFKEAEQVSSTALQSKACSGQ
jgi:hypothetical protein